MGSYFNVETHTSLFSLCQRFVISALKQQSPIYPPQPARENLPRRGVRQRGSPAEQLRNRWHWNLKKHVKSTFKHMSLLLSSQSDTDKHLSGLGVGVVWKLLTRSRGKHLGHEDWGVRETAVLAVVAVASKASRACPLACARLSIYLSLSLYICIHIYLVGPGNSLGVSVAFPSLTFPLRFRCVSITFPSTFPSRFRRRFHCVSVGQLPARQM